MTEQKEVMQVQSAVVKWRKILGITQAQLASEMGQSAGTLSQKEHGYIKWQQDDLEFFNGRGLSSDVVLGFQPLPLEVAAK